MQAETEKRKLRMGVSFGDGTAYYVGHLPGRKQECLYKHEGSLITVLAYIRNERCADEIEKLLLRFS